MRRALVFGGSGQVGRAIIAALLRAGWEVDATTAAAALPDGCAGARRLAPVESRAGTMRARAYDAVVDTMAMTAADALDLQAAECGRLVVISTASVHADARGLGFESPRFPRYPVPVREDQAMVAPGPGYSAGKVAMEQALGPDAVILRPGAIWGIGARHPREWWVVKRLLDGRVRVPLAYRGASRFHCSSAAGIAGLAVRCLEGGHRGALNVADAQAETVLERVLRIAEALGRPVEPVLSPGAGRGRARVGHTPFSVPRPVVLALDRAHATGWDNTEAGAAWPGYLDWLCAQEDWKAAFPMFARYGHDPFDYAAEDAWLARCAPSA